ncbi:MAG: TMEM175 family protein [Burkholderiaceae bacterium]
MGKGRFEAFSDGVLAIIITIMVLELHVPHGDDLAALAAQWPIFLSYVLSFVYVGIYWNNHRHLLHATSRVTGGMLWANLHLLFWLSLFPFATGWMGENHFAPLPSAMYGGVLLMAAISWAILQAVILRAEGPRSLLRQALGRDWKGRFSPVLYLAGIVSSFWITGLAQALYLVVALAWLVPDRRIEAALRSRGD